MVRIMSSDPGIVADSSSTGLTGQLGEVWASLADLGQQLSDADWTAATACPGWPVSAQYAHIIGTESSLLGRPNPDVETGSPEHVRNPIGGFNELWVVALADLPRAEVLDQFVEVTEARRKALAGMTEEDFAAPSWTPIGQADYRRFMQIRVFDCWVHEQDVRDAVGRSGHESGPAAEQSLDEIVRALGYLIGKRAAAPAGSSVRVELTGPVTRRVDVAVIDGRARVVSGLDGAPTATITLSSSAFTRLACGRVAPARVIEGGDCGGVELAGDVDLGDRVVRNLAFTI
jgi:uncharacterized protein (TIGR03083 family)